ncbi:LPS export ABC transporter permease LptG [Marinicauda pacifica]|uniref:LptF/LptG family permease n=1 Tax=Marinicauda pacifica TaxID=1133559 RepID=A0A4S2HF39_9PROT|nr:LptF/LptG family permease [Marinicauda pacifica]TGY94704.1 LptF/LptG family permease [Marinicauda pacifica]GGE38067.1 LPS export ABC transporter permease LptG [Marinicauda pacifica]
MSRLARYLILQTLLGILASAGVISAVIILVDFVETSRDISTRADLTALQALGLTLLKSPLLIQETLPFIVLFGTLWAFFRLNRRSELIVMRAAGYSAWRILLPAASLAFVIGVAGTAVLSPLGAMSNARFETIRETILDGQTGMTSVSAGPVWLRETSPDGFNIITASRFDAEEGQIFTPVFRIYLRSEAGAPILVRRIEAESARLSSGFWVLDEAVELTADAPREKLGEISLQTSIGRQALFERARSPGGISFWDLPGVIASARAAGLSTRPYELRFQSLLAQPLTIVAAALLAIAATLRLVRLGGAAGFAFAGGAAGFLLYFLQELMLSLGRSGTIDTISAAWSAPALFILAAMFYVAYTEDG